VNQAAHDGASVADDRVCHEAQRLLQDREPRRRRAIALDFAVPGECADPHPPFSVCTYASSLRRLMSTMSAGSASRMFKIGIRLWPPASTLPSVLARASSLVESVGRWYLNGAGFIRDPPVDRLSEQRSGKRSGSRGPRRMSEK
jgi:hypothetical protein